MNEPVIVKLSVEHMRQQILTALSSNQISADVQAAVDRAVRDFNFEEEVSKITYRILTNTIGSAIQSAAFELTRDPEFKDRIAEGLAVAIKKVL